jgi:hypothetical protein
VLRTAEALPDTIIVLDEAYIEFSEAPSLAAEAARRDNLVVLRTLSKGLRPGRRPHRLRDRHPCADRPDLRARCRPIRCPAPASRPR